MVADKQPQQAPRPLVLSATGYHGRRKEEGRDGGEEKRGEA